MLEVGQLKMKFESLAYDEEGQWLSQEYFVNMGPQHPSTHGVLRLVLRMDGEIIREVIPVLGYIHRGIEKMAEHLGSRQIVHLTDRMDYLSSAISNWGVALTVERALKIELTDRIEVIRTLMAELERIQSHLLWWGVLGMDLGAVTSFFYGFRDRETITDIFEETTGARLTLNYIQPGGLMFDIHPNFVARVKKAMADLKPRLQEYHTLLSENIILQNRLQGVGILETKKAIALGATGPMLRASGVPWDLRKIHPYGAYHRVQFEIPVGQLGDSWDRYWVRLEEIKQSISIVEQLVDNIPEGKTMVLKPAKKLVLPKQNFYGLIETARGALGVFIQGGGSEFPVRCHFRSPNFNNLWSITEMARGSKIADLVAILSTIDLVIPDVDR